MSPKDQNEIPQTITATAAASWKDVMTVQRLTMKCNTKAMAASNKPQHKICCQIIMLCVYSKLLTNMLGGEKQVVLGDSQYELQTV